jgi:hypothetical protein
MRLAHQETLEETGEPGFPVQCTSLALEPMQGHVTAGASRSC